MDTGNISTMKTIGIIGGGAAGLCALRHVISHEQFSAILWEQADEIGGTWIYTPNIGKDEYGLPIHSSMYKNLLTNLPKEIMAFPDYPFKETEKSFIHHTEVLQYLKDYTDHFELNPWIKFNHRVEAVEPIEESNRFTKWRITVKNLKEGSSSTSVCDFLFICNGHYSKPRYPTIENLDLFKGKQMHSHSYRIPDEYHGTKTVILGASSSGLDISLEVAKVAQKVFLSHNHPIPFPSKLPDNVVQVKGVKEARENGFVLRDDSFVDADAIIYCTGYEFTFPFLSPSCKIHVEDNQVKTLYKHMINAAFPTMCFVGIPFQILPFPLFDVQSQYIMQIIKGDISVPSLEEVDSEMKISSVPKRRYHRIGLTKQWSYFEDLQKEMKVGHLASHYRKITKIVIFRVLFCFLYFKKFSYSSRKIGNDVEIEERLDGQLRNTKLELIFTVFNRLCILLIFNFISIIKSVYTLGFKGVSNFL